MSHFLEIEELVCGYGNAVVLDGISLHADHGKIVSVLGPNGAGKSTLMNAIGGLISSKGRVMFDGEDVSRLAIEERLMRGIALVPETRELFSTMSVEQNLLLGGCRPRKLGRPDWKKGLDVVYDVFPRMLERRAQRASTLSGGERQMLAIGRAMMSDPRLLLLDEPSLGLAPLIVQEIMKVVGRLSEGGLTVLLVEQNARAALEISSYGYVFETGAIAVEGTSAELRANDRLVETYLGR